MSFLSTITRQAFSKTLRKAPDMVSHTKPLEAEVAQKPLNPVKKAAYQLEAKWKLSISKTPDKDRFNFIKERLDQEKAPLDKGKWRQDQAPPEESFVLNMARKKISDRDWSGFNLSRINFEGAKLNNIRAINSCMDGSSLSRTYATDCDFSKATIKDAYAECFHAETSTFKDATISGYWNRSGLPAAIHEPKTNVTGIADTKLDGVQYAPPPGLEQFHDVMRRTGNTSRVQVRAALAEHAKANNTSIREALDNIHTSGQPRAHIPARNTLNQPKTPSESSTRPLSSEVSSIYGPSQSSSITRNTSNSSLRPSPLESTPPTSLESSMISNAPARSLSTTRQSTLNAAKPAQTQQTQPSKSGGGVEEGGNVRKTFYRLKTYLGTKGNVLRKDPPPNYSRTASNEYKIEKDPGLPKIDWEAWDKDWHASLKEAIDVSLH